jgi:hypothetical protein
MERKPVHSATESVQAVWLHQRSHGPFAGLMEKIMSKSNDIWQLGPAPTQDLEMADLKTLDLNSVATFTVRELRDDELQKVTGAIAVKYTMFWDL